MAKPTDPEWLINAQLLLGKNLLLTPGVYNVAQSLQVRWPNQVVLGIGHATLTAVNGATPLKVADVPGAIVAGVTIDAGLKESKTLLQVGDKHGFGLSSASNPTTLSDVYFRVGGPHIGKTDTALEVNSDNVLIDHTWVWRADHGVEGFTGGDTERWNTNTGRVRRRDQRRRRHRDRPVRRALPDSTTRSGTATAAPPCSTRTSCRTTRRRRRTG